MVFVREQLKADNGTWKLVVLTWPAFRCGFCAHSFTALYLFGSQGHIGGENNTKLAWSNEETKVF